MLRWTDPADLVWQKNLMDLMFLGMFALASGCAVVAWRRGRRIDVLVLVAALWYGLFLELSGMMIHNSYQQGTFVLMLDWGWVPGLRDATLMPSYVPIFYPVMLYTGFRIVDSLGITALLQRAIAGGAIMLALDAPYIIEGGLRHVVWWTWGDWNLYQLWQGWPAMDAWWQTTWGAAFLFAVYRFAPTATATPRRLLLGSLGIGGGLNVVGPLLHLPLLGVTLAGWPQWPFMGVLAVVAWGVAIRAIATGRPRAQGGAVGLVAGYVAAMGAMVIANAVYEGGLTLYIGVQALGLLALATLVALPYAQRRAASSGASEREVSVGGSPREDAGLAG
ncbi:hypothetical protein [Nocardioides acrostichi]|uniref:Uncharacterized protein n=1 Tax=Nocardioides acrostichi TaxID=2784339 RepID=A0A930UX31_9ACTN|nr:hypothetical protein [Nocardioides acrostichi]MBF4162468.1 hypothetical protein [Nocardioides acrostichi]